jgi:hypothetical protein
VTCSLSRQLTLTGKRKSSRHAGHQPTITYILLLSRFSSACLVGQSKKKKKREIVDRPSWDLLHDRRACLSPRPAISAAALRLPIRHALFFCAVCGTLPGGQEPRDIEVTLVWLFLVPFSGQAYDDAWSSHTSPAPRPRRLPSYGTVFLKYPSQSAMKRTSLRGYGMLPASYHTLAFSCHLVSLRSHRRSS